MAGLETTPEMFDLRMSEDVRPLFDAVKKFIAEEVNPHTKDFFELGEVVAGDHTHNAGPEHPKKHTRRQ